MRVQTYFSCLAAAAIGVFASASVSRADFSICNRTGEPVIIDLVGPSNVCTNGYSDRSVLDDDICATFYRGSARGKRFYISAQSQVSDWTWFGPERFFIPYESFEWDLAQNSLCVADCGDEGCDGDWYDLNEYTATRTNDTLTLTIDE